MNTKKYLLVLILTFALSVIPSDSFANNYRGQLSANPYAPNSISNPYGSYGNPYSSQSLNNPYGAGNPYTNHNIKIYDSNGNYHGKISNNPYDADSISNPYGQYGNPYSAASIKNPYGAGNPYSANSPTNPYGQGMSLYEDNE